MNLKTLILFILLLLSPHLSDAQTQFIKDTDSISIEQYSFFVEHTEKYYICVKIIDEQEEEIFLLTELLEEKHDQLQMSELLINTQRNEVERLQRHRTFLGVGLGVSLVGVLLLAL